MNQVRVATEMKMFGESIYVHFSSALIIKFFELFDENIEFCLVNVNGFAKMAPTSPLQIDEQRIAERQYLLSTTTDLSHDRKTLHNGGYTILP